MCVACMWVHVGSMVSSSAAGFARMNTVSDTKRHPAFAVIPIAACSLEIPFTSWKEHCEQL